MKLVIKDDYQAVSLEAFNLVKEVVVEGDVVLGLATGSSPGGLYELMIKDHQENKTSYRDVVTFNLDEYVGLDRNHPESYYTYMHKHLFSGIDIKEENVHIPRGDVSDLALEAKEYEELLEKNQIDLQILGIGSNGHIGFNEPGTSFDSVTSVVDLTAQTIQDNARFFNDDESLVPTQAISMGISSIMRAKKIVVIASGENKALAVAGMINGEVTTDLPASILQNHPDVTVIVDKAAASELE